MASIITVKKLRTLLADKALDGSVALLGAGDVMLIGSSERPTHMIDFFQEELLSGSGRPLAEAAEAVEATPTRKAKK